MNALLANNKCTEKSNTLAFQDLHLAAVAETFKK